MEPILQSGAAGENHPANERLLLYLDGELSLREAGRLRAHLEACWLCRSNAARMEAAIAGFMEFESLRANCGAPPTPESFRARLARATSAAPSRQHWSGKWRVGLGAAGIVAAAATIVMLIPALSVVHADAILKESSVREHAWQHQAGKVLCWVDEEELQGNPRLANGRYRTLRWQSNIEGRTGSLIRKYDASGRLVWARWGRTDGSEAVFDPNKSPTVVIYPSTAEMKDYAARNGHPEWLRSEIRSTELESHPDLAQQEAIDRFQRSVGLGQVEQVRLPGFGLVYHIHSRPATLRMEIDYYISTETLHRVGLRTVRFAPDGAIIATENSHMVTYRDSSLEEFDRNDLHNEMANAREIACILPEQLLTRSTQRSQKQPGASR
jgi:hypothetical protein